jgi:hypothetical protein
MHFLPVPPFLDDLTAVELALVSKITGVMRIHVLRTGMLSSAGHVTSLPNTMHIATTLPLLPTEVDIIILKRRGTSTNLRATRCGATLSRAPSSALCTARGRRRAPR